MKTYIITENEAGQRLDRFLGKLLPGAPASFFYKMLRKKNITLNSKKAEGSLKLSVGDEVKLFLSDETIEGFLRPDPTASHDHYFKNVHLTKADYSSADKENTAESHRQKNTLRTKDIIFENHDIIIINKPAGVLSQKAKPDDISMNELLLSYMMDKGKLARDDMRAFRPAVCNRLDRNTSGVILAGKSALGLRYLSDLLREKGIKKYYYALVKGEEVPPHEIEAYLTKDEAKNTVQVTMKRPYDMSQTLKADRPKVSGTKTEGYDMGKTFVDDCDIRKVGSTEIINVDVNRGSTSKTGMTRTCMSKPVVIRTRIEQLSCRDGFALLEIELVTGKSHQIRAQLAAIGHPVIGDAKYGDTDVNKLFYKTCHVRRQLLHARRVVFPHSETFDDVSCKEFVAELPSDFKYTLKSLRLNP